MVNQILVDFIRTARKRNYPDDMLRRGLLEKGWPLTEVNSAFQEANIVKREVASYIIPKQPNIQPEIKIEVSHSKFSFKWIGSGVAIFVLLAFTILIFSYIYALTNYTVIDPVTQKESTKKCLLSDCSDAKEYALSAMKEKGMINLLIAVLLTSAILGVYKVIRFKKAFIWILNVLYLFVLGVLFYLWLRFSQ